MRKSVYFKLVILVNLLLVYISWGSVYIGFKFTLEVLGPFWACGARMVLPGAIMAVCLIAAGKWRWPNGREWLRANWMAMFLVLFASGFLSKGQEYITSGMAAVVSGSTPISMLVGVWLFAGEKRPTLTQFIGLGAGFCGLLLLATQSSGVREESNLLGMFWILMATFGWVCGTILTKRMPRHDPLSAMECCALYLFTGGLQCLLVGLVCGEAQMMRWQNLDLKVAIAFGWMVLGGSIIAYSCYMWLLRHVSTAVAVSYEYVVPIIGIFLGWWLGGEVPTNRMWLACALILGAVFFVLHTNKGHSPRKRLHGRNFDSAS